MQLSPIAEAAIFGDVAPARAPEAIPGQTKEAPAPETPDDGGKTPEQSKSEAKPAPEAPKGPSLFDAIKAEREAREAKAAADAERETLKKQAEEAQAKLKDIEGAKKNMLVDAVGYLQRYGLSEKEIALVGESIMYWLVPDKAPDNHRARLVEAQRYRDQQAEEERKAQAAKEAQEAEERQAKEYYANLEAQVTSEFTAACKTFAAGTYPDSQAWFADDHGAYAQSLMHTAKNLAEAARKAGTQADLSIPSVAKALEADLSTRFGRVRGKAQQEPAKQKLDEQPTSEKTPVTPKNKTPDAQRIARAVAAAFGG